MAGAAAGSALACGERLFFRFSCSCWRWRSSVPDLVGVQQPGDAEEVVLLLGAHLGAGAELAAVEEHPVEGRLRLSASNLPLVSSSEAFSSRLASAMSASSGLTRPSLSSFSGRSSAWSRSSSIELASAMSVGTDGRNTDAVSPRLRARTKRPTAWAKNSGVEVEVA